jgi:hypothetical protein
MINTLTLFVYSSCGYGHFCANHGDFHILLVIYVDDIHWFGLSGSSKCTPCSTGTYSSVAGASSCSACPADRQCLLGAAQPSAAASSDVDITKMAATRPSIKQSPIAAELASQADANTNLRTAVLGIGGALLVLFLALAIAAQKVDAVGLLVNCSTGNAEKSDEPAASENSTSTVSFSKASTPVADSIWVKLDLVFSSMHYVPPGGVKEVRQTAFGGMMTIVFLVAILALSAQLAVDNLTVVYTTSIIGETPPWDPHGTYRLTVRAHGIGLEACNKDALYFQDTTADWTSTGGTIGSAWSATGTGSSLEGGVADGSCTIVWTCRQCKLLRSAGTPAVVVLFAPSRAWATYIEYTIETPQLTSSATSGEASSLPVFTVQVSHRDFLLQ